MLDFWNERYRAATYAYGRRPNEYLAQQLAALPAGRLLLPAEGEGRNAVFAAQQGWQVQALDYSEAGRAKALAWGAEAGVSFAYDLADLSEVALPPDTYDAVGLIFVHLPPPARVHLHAQVARSLRPGGWLMLEAFAPGQLGRTSGGPQQPALLYDEASLQADFAGLYLQHAQTRLRILDEGPYHQGEAEVVQVLMQRPR